MQTGQFRYWALALGSGLVALGVILEKLPEEAYVAALIAIIGLASADVIKHRNDAS